MVATVTSSEYLLPSMDFEPAYAKLYGTGELQQRVEQALEELGRCYICPRDCGVDRLADKTAACKTGRYAQVSSYFPHFGEEDCLRGWEVAAQFSFLCAIYAACSAKTLISVKSIVVRRSRLASWLE